MAIVKKYQSVVFTGSESEIIYVESKTVAALIIPNDSTFNGMNVTFKAVVENDSFTLKDALGNSVSATLSAGSYIALDLPYFTGITYLKLISSGSLSGKSVTVVYREL